MPSATTRHQPTTSQPAPASVPQLLYSVADASAALSVSRAGLYELIGRGELPVCKLGRRTLVHRADLEELADRVRAGEVRT